MARASCPCVSRASCPRFEGGTPSTQRGSPAAPGWKGPPVAQPPSAGNGTPPGAAVPPVCATGPAATHRLRGLDSISVVLSSGASEPETAWAKAHPTIYTETAWAQAHPARSFSPMIPPGLPHARPASAERLHVAANLRCRGRPALESRAGCPRHGRSPTNGAHKQLPWSPAAFSCYSRPKS